MEKNIVELKNENSPEVKEYFEFIKDSVADKSYFKDGLNWYFFRYLKPVCDRTILIFGSIISVVVLYFLIEMIQNSFPLVEEKPIIVTAIDETRFYPKLISLKKRDNSYNVDYKNVDQVLAKYLIEYYVKERESFDFSDGELNKVNRKYDRVKNMSSLDEYRIFQKIMSKDNPSSPINFFGQDVTRSVEIDSFNYIFEDETNQGIAIRAKNFLISKVPQSAQVYFTATTKTKISEVNSEIESERFMVKIDFYFDGVNSENEGEIDFAIKSYELYKIK